MNNERPRKGAQNHEPVGRTDFAGSDTRTGLRRAVLCGAILMAAARPAAAVVTLPVEVQGASTATATVSFNGPTAASAATATRFWMLAHALTYPDKASVQINGGAWINLNNSTAQVEGQAAKYGGIGAPIATFPLSFPVPANSLRTGPNTVSFRFNKTDGVSTGFRVLAFNFRNAQGGSLVSSLEFVQDNPGTWKPPLTSAADIAAGKTLWMTAQLRASSLPGAGMLRARCTDCHAQDGRDLKYFNYSNLSIIERSKYHGMTDLQAKQVASYIRSLPVANPGRPWNPPYQPGPGTDSKPLAHWAAGAGVDKVLARDADMLPFLFPGGINREAVSRKGITVNLRELPISLPLPDWNRWLPKIHPKDAFGDAWVNDNSNKLYAGQGSGSASWNLRARLTGGTAYRDSKAGFFTDNHLWSDAVRGFLLPRRPSNVWDPNLWPRDLTEKFHSMRLWQLVKLWEMHQEFVIEGNGARVFPAPFAEPRMWFTRAIWQVAPHELWIAPGATVSISPLAADRLTHNGQSASWLYWTNSWFYLQMVLNSGDGEAGVPYNAPDQEYLNNHAFSLGFLGDPQALRNTAAYVRWMQIRPSTDARFLPYQKTGWNPYLIYPAVLGINRPEEGLPQATGAAVMKVLLDEWVDKNRDFPPLYLIYAFYDPAYVPPKLYNNSLGSRLYDMLLKSKASGVDTSYAVTWAKSYWSASGAAEWDKLR
jgi:hypothetical protein